MSDLGKVRFAEIRLVGAAKFYWVDNQCTQGTA